MKNNPKTSLFQIVFVFIKKSLSSEHKVFYFSDFSHWHESKIHKDLKENKKTRKKKSE